MNPNLRYYTRQNKIRLTPNLIKIRLDISASLRSSPIGEERREAEISSLILIRLGSHPAQNKTMQINFQYNAWAFFFFCDIGLL